MNVAPSAWFEAVIDVGETGLVGTIGLRVNDNLGATTVAFDATHIVEIATGVYAANTRTAPGTAGQYTLIWTRGAGGEVLGIEDLLVTSEVTAVTIGSGHLYVTREDLKTMLSLKNESFADAAIDVAVEAASRAIDGYKRARYYPTSETRVYTPWSRRDQALKIDDVVSVTAVNVDTDGDLVYDTSWVEGTDFVLDPANAELEGRPKTSILLLPKAGRHFPVTARAIKVEGSFGWAEAPGLVVEAAILLAHRFLTRSRSAPLGILVSTANDMVAQARLGRIDLDAAFLLDQLPDSKPAIASSQLG